MNITVYNENLDETTTDPKRAEKRKKVLAVHPNGIHNTLKNLFEEMDNVNVKTATLQTIESDLSDEVLENTDVLVWWGHVGHDKVPDEIVEKIHKRVLAGMGLMLLHSAHYSKLVPKILGTTGTLRWNEDAYSRVFCVDPTHPIAKGIPEHFELGSEECYAEFFDIPKPDDLIFVSWYDIGEVFRSGCTWSRGYGKIFYFQPGHETYSAYQNENVIKILKNAVNWLEPVNKRTRFDAPKIKVTLEELRKA